MKSKKRTKTFHLKHRLLDFKKIRFEVRDSMRYDDVGDYFDHTIVSYDMEDPVVNNAIFIHEFIEYCLIKSAGIDPKLIDKIDMDEKYEKKYPEVAELYTKFHELANRVERQFIKNLGRSWRKHDNKIYSTKVPTEVQKITDELHKPNPSKKKMEKSKLAMIEALKS